MLKIISYSKLLENTFFSNTNIAQDLPILLKALNDLWGSPLQLDISSHRIRFHNISSKKQPFAFAIICDKPDQQVCCGYFLRDEFQNTLQVSQDTANCLSIGLNYVQDFFKKLGYLLIHQGSLTRNPPPMLFQPDDRIIYFFEGEPYHCALIASINTATNQPIISHKMGFGPPEIQSWSKLFDKYNEQNTLTIYKNLLTYKVYRKFRNC